MAVHTNKNLLVKNNYIGEDGELGSKLLAGFLGSIKDCDTLPGAIFFIHKGVLVTTKEEYKPIIEILKHLETLGVKIYSCRTCLDYFNLTNQLKVGEIGNAKDTLESLLSADNTISL